MNETLFSTKGWLTICVAGWLVGTSAPAYAATTTSSAPSARAASEKTTPQLPLTVENPYAASQPAAATPRVPSAPAGPIAGALVDVGAASTPWSPQSVATSCENAATRSHEDLAPPLPPLMGTASARANKTSSANPTARLIAVTPSAAGNPPLSWGEGRCEGLQTETSHVSATQPTQSAADHESVPPSSVEASPPVRVAERTSRTPPPAAAPITQLTETNAGVEPSTFPYTSTTEQLSAQLLPAVQRGYVLAQRGALFAAQTEFIQVLRRVAQAKDAAEATDDHSQSLAAGLRALDEADDFVPQGTQLEAELNVRIVASSHRTPVLRDYPTDVPPHEAVALYHSFAQQKLSDAVLGEQAGSMVLHGMGKIYARQAERNDDNVQLTRRAMTMHHAALTACPENHMAANELGVLLVRTGHPVEAVPLFERTIDLAPSAMSYHNLAMAQQKMGLTGQAAANEQESQRLATWERSNGAASKRAGVEWVSPGEMARVAAPAEIQPATAMRPEPPRSTWQKTVDKAKSLTGVVGNRAQETTLRR